MSSLRRLEEAARELQWTALSTWVGAVTVSDEGGDLDRQPAGAVIALGLRTAFPSPRPTHACTMQANLRTARARDSAQQRVYAHEPSGDGDGGRSSATAAAVASGQIEQAGALSAAAAEAGLLELHEEYVRSRTILELAQFRPVVVDAVFGDKAGAGRQKQALKAAITDRDRLVLDLCHKVETLRGLEAQVRTRSEERCRLMLRTRTLADAKMQLEAERRRRNDSAEDRAGVAATRAAITLQIKRSIILRNVMASLILESGVDWSQDPELSELVMSDSSHLQSLT